jgi:hypothetical protein
MDLSKYIDLILKLLTPEEWRGLFLILIMVTCIVEVIKRTLLVRLNRQRRKQIIYGTGFIVGIPCAWLLWPAHSAVPWIVFGVAAGPVANSLHWVTLILIAWKFPGLAYAIKGKKPPPASTE